MDQNKVGIFNSQLAATNLPSGEHGGVILIPLNVSLQVVVPNPVFIGDNGVDNSKGTAVDNGVEYYTYQQFHKRIEHMTSKERQAIIKFMGLSHDATTDEIAQTKWKQFESFSKSEEMWGSVESTKEYIDHMLKFLTGSLMMTSGYGGPLDPESYLILPELIRLTQLGCPTLNSQPGEERIYGDKLGRQLPYVEFFCPKRMAISLQQEIAKNYTVLMKCHGQDEVFNIDPRNKEGEFSALQSTKNSEGKWVPDDGSVTDCIQSLGGEEGDYRFSTETQFCENSCLVNFQQNYAYMIVIGKDYSNSMFSNIITSVENLTD
jgi:hypothetical protein